MRSSARDDTARTLTVTAPGVSKPLRERPRVPRRGIVPPRGAADKQEMEARQSYETRRQVWLADSDGARHLGIIIGRYVRHPVVYVVQPQDGDVRNAPVEELVPAA